MADHDFVIRCNYMKDGSWIREEIELGYISYNEAVRQFKSKANEMENLYGDTHFWTCTLRSETGDYFQVFHQRMVDGYLNY